MSLLSVTALTSICIFICIIYLSIYLTVLLYHIYPTLLSYSHSLNLLILRRFLSLAYIYHLCWTISPCSGVIDTHSSHISLNVSYSRMGLFFPRAGQPGYRVVPHTPLIRLYRLTSLHYLYSVIKTLLFFKNEQVDDIQEELL